MYKSLKEKPAEQAVTLALPVTVLSADAATQVCYGSLYAVSYTHLIKTDAAFGVAASVFVFSYFKNTIVICDKSSALEWNSCEKSATKKRHESRVYPRCGKHGWLEDQ